VSRRQAATPIVPFTPPAGVSVDDEDFDGIRALVCGAPSPSATVVWFHGGGYRLGTIEGSLPFASALAARIECRMVLPSYRLAPEHPFPAALHDATNVLDHLRGIAGSPLIVAGDSAGGGLAMALSVACLVSGKQTPDGIILLSPWVDLSVTSPTFVSRAQSGQLFPAESAADAAELYLQGEDPRHPLASPLFAELAGLPPTIVFAGGAETLLGDGIGLVSRLAQAGVSVEGHFPAGMQHIWPILFGDLDESMAAFEAIERFVRSLTKTPNGGVDALGVGHGEKTTDQASPGVMRK
jgi:acetyl esterase/lipase